MTNEEAIKRLSKCGFCEECPFNEKDCYKCEEAYNMAISALKEKADLISRTDLLNAIWQKEYGKDYDGVNLLKIPHIDIIEQMPSTTPVIVNDIKFYDDYKAELDIRKKKTKNKGEPMDFMKERDSAIIDLVLNDDLTKYKEYCKKYKVPMPSNERIMKAAIYKASQHCLFIPAEIKELARKKCIELGFRPDM